jgi:hypothetical protein
MSDDDALIHTETVSWGFRTTSPIVLDETSRTRTVFMGEIHDGKLRSHMVRQRKGEGGEWLDINEVNFNQIPPDAGVKIELNTAATERLFDRLVQLRRIADSELPPSGSKDFVVAPAEEVVRVVGRERAQAIRILLALPLTQEDWEALIESAPDIAISLAEAQLLHQRKATIDEFESSLREHSDDEAFWQEFFKKNPWMLEAAFSAAVVLLADDIYIGGKRAGSRHGLGGSVADFLFSDESTKSFAVVEIKTPSTRLIGARYRGSPNEANEIFSPSSELSGAVVQVGNQIASAVADFDHVLRESYPTNLDRVHPKGVLIVGQKDGLGPRELASLNLFRHKLFSLTVIAYDELLRRLRIMYDLEIPTAPEQ